MNLSPDWVPVLKSHGWSVVHWSTVGDPRASDRTIMEWAAKHEYVVLTHDLDFGAMLALSHAAGPSVLQVRAGDILPDHLEDSVIAERCRLIVGSADVFWLKDKSLTDLDNLPEPDDLAEEIIENLEAGLNSFRQVLTGLRQAGS